MARPPPTEADVTRLLGAIFDRCTADGKLPELLAAVMNKLSEADPNAAMVVVKILLEEALARLPDHDRDEILRQFAELANGN